MGDEWLTEYAKIQCIVGMMVDRLKSWDGDRVVKFCKTVAAKCSRDGSYPLFEVDDAAPYEIQIYGWAKQCDNIALIAIRERLGKYREELEMKPCKFCGSQSVVVEWSQYRDFSDLQALSRPVHGTSFCACRDCVQRTADRDFIATQPERHLFGWRNL